MAENVLVRKRAPIGRSGLQIYGGFLVEEWNRALQGDRGRRVFREMADQDPTCGALLFAIENLLRGVEWRVEPYSDDPADVERAEFVSSLADDMKTTWQGFMAEVTAMFIFGFAPFEIVYKRRADGAIGWDDLAIRAPESVDQWELDEHENVTGMHQQLNVGHDVVIPIEKLLVFRTTSKKSNPEGRSILRSAFLPWFRKRRIEEAEAIGVERDLAGMPIFYVPPELFDPNASEDKRAQLAAYRAAGEGVKNDEQACLVMPALFDERSNRLVEFQLAGTGSRRLFDTSAIATRYDQAIARTVLADFLFLGMQKVGSFALSSDKTELFSTALGAWLSEIADVLNRHGLPRLFRLNGWDPTQTPRYVPGDLEEPEVEKFAVAVTALTGAGWLTPGGRDDEAVVRERLGLPEPPEEDELAMRRAENAALAAPEPEPDTPDTPDTPDVAKHAPGAHDQQSHARGGGGAAFNERLGSLPVENGQVSTSEFFDQSLVGVGEMQRGPSGRPVPDGRRIETVSLGDLHPSQDAVFVEGIVEHASGSRTPIVAARVGGRTVVIDGHHRVAAATLNGQSTIRARFVRLQSGLIEEPPA